MHVVNIVPTNIFSTGTELNSEQNVGFGGDFCYYTHEKNIFEDTSCQKSDTCIKRMRTVYHFGAQEGPFAALQIPACAHCMLLKTL